jgi:hypothetical protein
MKHVHARTLNSVQLYLVVHRTTLTNSKFVQTINSQAGLRYQIAPYVTDAQYGAFKGLPRLVASSAQVRRSLFYYESVKSATAPPVGGATDSGSRFEWFGCACSEKQ